MSAPLTFGIRIKLDGTAEVVNGGKAVSGALDGIGKQAEQTAQSGDRLAEALGRVAHYGVGGLGLAATVTGLVRTADAMTNLESRLKLVTSGFNELAAAQADVFRIAQSTRSSLEATGDVYYKMSKGAEALGMSQAQVARLTLTVSQAMTLSGSSTESAKAALMQFGQALSSGVLRGEELNSVMEQAPALAEAIAKGMGKSVGELRKLGEAGELTVQQLMAALEKSAPEVARQFATLAPTVGGAYQQLSNSAAQFIAQLDRQTQSSHALAGAIQFVSGHFEAFAGVAAMTAAVGLGGLLGKQAQAIALARAQAAEQAALTASTFDLNAALGVKAAQTASASTAMIAARGVMGALGGPLGLLTTALTVGASAWMLFGESADEAGRKSAEALMKVRQDALERGHDEKAAIQASIADKKRTQASAFNEYQAAQSPAEKSAIWKKYGLGQLSDDIRNAEAEVKKIEERDRNLAAKIAKLDTSDKWQKSHLTPDQKKQHDLAELEKDYVAETSRFIGNAEKQLQLVREYRERRAAILAKGASTGKSAGQSEKRAAAEEEAALAKILGYSSTYLKDLAAIQRLRDQGQLSAEEHAEAVKKLYLSETEGGKAAVSQAVALQKAREKGIDAYIEKLDRQKLAEADAVDAVTHYVGGLSEAGKLRELELSLMFASDAQRQTALEQYRIELDLQKQIADIRAKIHDADRQADEIARASAAATTAKAQAATYHATRQSAEAFKEFWGSLDRTAHDTWVSIANGGADTAERLRNTFKNVFFDWLYQMAARPLLFSVSATVGSTLGIPGASGASGAGGMINSASSAYNLYNSVSGTGGYAARAGALMDGVMGTTAAPSQGFMLMQQGAAFEGSQAAMLAAQTQEFGAAGAALTDAAAGAGAGMAEGFLAAIPGWGWAALGVGALLGGSSLFEGDGPAQRTGNWKTSSATFGDASYNSKSRFGYSASDDNHWFGGDMSAGLKSFATTLGKVDDALANSLHLTDTQIGHIQDRLITLNGKQYDFGKEGEDWTKSAAPADIMKDRYGAVFDEFNAGLGDMVRAVEGGADAVQSTVGGLADLVHTFDIFGVSTQYLTKDLIDANGGVDSFRGGLGYFFTNFYTDAEQRSMSAGAAQRELNAAFAEYGVAVPDSLEGWKSLYLAIDQTTEAGRKAAATMLKLSPTAVAAYGGKSAAQIEQDTQRAADDEQRRAEEARRQREEEAKKAADLVKSRRGLEIQVMELQGNTSGALALRREVELSAMDASLRPLQQRIYALQDEKTAADALLSAQRSLVDGQVSAISALQQSRDGIRDFIDGLDGDILALNRVDPQFDAAGYYTQKITAWGDRYNTLAGASDANTPDSLQEQLDLGKKIQGGLMERYRIEAEALQKNLELTKGLRQTILDIRTSELSPLTNAQKLAEARTRFEADVAAANKGDAEAKARVGQEGQTLLKLGQGYFGSSAGYAGSDGLYQYVMKSLGNLAGTEQSLEQIQTAYNARAIELARDTKTALQGIKGISETRLVSVDTTLGSLARDLGTYLGKSGDLYSAIIGTLPQKIADLIGKPELGNQALTVSGNPHAGTQDIRDYVSSTVDNHGGAKGDLNGAFREMYFKFRETGVSSAQVASATGWKQSDIISWATAQGLPAFDVGTNLVPFDMPAVVHANERIMPAADNRRLFEILESPRNNDSALAAKLDVVVEELQRLRAENARLTALLAEATVRSNEDAAVVVASAVKSAAQNRQSRAGVSG